MSLYKTHSRLNIFLFLPTLLLITTYFLKTNYNSLIIFSSAFIYGTLFLGPDLDVADKIKLFSIRGFFTFPFRGYAKLFRHRGISHSILFGTATRFIYLSILMAIICYILDKSYLHTESILDFMKRYKSFLLTIYFGFFVSDFFHILLDKFTPKRFLPKKYR